MRRTLLNIYGWDFVLSAKLDTSWFFQEIWYLYMYLRLNSRINPVKFICLNKKKKWNTNKTSLCFLSHIFSDIILFHILFNSYYWKVQFFHLLQIVIVIFRHSSKWSFECKLYISVLSIYHISYVSIYTQLFSVHSVLNFFWQINPNFKHCLVSGEVEERTRRKGAQEEREGRGTSIYYH